MPMWSCSVIAPTGHTAPHWPHCTHTTSSSSWQNAGPTTVLKPRFCGHKAATPCTLLQTVTQRRQRMHLAVSRVRAGVLWSW